MNCNDVLQELGDYLDEDQRNELCRQIDVHLQQCKDCRFYVDTVKKTIVLYQADQSVELPVMVSSRLAAALGQEYGRRAPLD